MVNIQKAAIIGCGFVGASSAFSLLQKGDEVLFDYFFATLS